MNSSKKNPAAKRKIKIVAIHRGYGMHRKLIKIK
jgi:hypothetical protein